jgi:hypothetical protein
MDFALAAGQVAPGVTVFIVKPGESLAINPLLAM